MAVQLQALYQGRKEEIAGLLKEEEKGGGESANGRGCVGAGGRVLGERRVVAAAAGLAGLVQQWKEEFGQQSVTHVVRAELELVAVGCEAWRGGHDSGVEHQDVQARGFCKDRCRGFLDGVEGGEVQLEDLDAGVGHMLSDLVGCGVGFLDAPGREPDQ